MLYNLLPTNNRAVWETGLMFYARPEKHPTRLLDFHDIFFQLDGHWNVLLEKEEISLNPGDIAFLPAGHHHYGDKDCLPNTRTLYIHFEVKEEDRIAGEEEWENRRMDNPHGENLYENLYIESFIHPDNSRMLEIFQDMLKVKKSGSPYRELYCSALLSLLLIELSRSHLQMAVKRDEIVTKIREFLSFNTNSFFSINELSKKAGISPRSFSTRFKAETGQSIHHYQMNMKLHQIADILRNEAYTSLKTLALNFGFYDEFHLSSAFKQKYGASPKNYKCENSRTTR